MASARTIGSSAKSIARIVGRGVVGRGVVGFCIVTCLFGPFGAAAIETGTAGDDGYLVLHSDQPAVPAQDENFTDLWLSHEAGFAGRNVRIGGRFGVGSDPWSRDLSSDRTWLLGGQLDIGDFSAAATYRWDVLRLDPAGAGLWDFGVAYDKSDWGIGLHYLRDSEPTTSPQPDGRFALGGRLALGGRVNLIGSVQFWDAGDDNSFTDGELGTFIFLGTKIKF